MAFASEADNFSTSPATSADGRYVAFASLAGNLLAGTVPGVLNVYRRDVVGDAPVAGPVTAPVATPACKTLRLPPTPPEKDAPAAPADPAPIDDPGRTGQGDPVTLTAR